MIFLVTLRLCRCELCHEEWYLDLGAPISKRCPLCLSTVWRWGRDSVKTRQIRLGKTTVVKILDKGTASLLRQQHGRKQWRQFHSKEEDAAINRAKKERKALEDQAAKGDD